MAKKIVTGGAGFIGSHLVDALVANGDEVHVVDNYASGKYEDRFNPKALYHEVDVHATDKIQPIFSGADTIFHLAALPRIQYSIEHPVETADTNIAGVVSALVAASRAKARRLVYAASGSAYGMQEIMPLSEDLPARPVNPYGIQKYAGELFAAAWPAIYGLETVSLRYFNVYGPRLDPTGPYALAVGAFLLARKEGRPLVIYGDGTVTRDYTYVRDVVRATILASESGKVGKGEVINVGTGRNLTIRSLAEMFLPAGKQVAGEIKYASPRIEAHDSQADNRKARKLLGWEPTVALEEGVAELKKEWGLA